MGWYRRLRPLFFLLPPETAHHLGLSLLSRVGRSPWLQRAVRGRFPRIEDPVQLLGLTFPNRVGLAAGYDKDAVAWRGLAALGFGHLELGTVTPEAQPGNPRPRVFRLGPDRGLINRLGFPSRGEQALARTLEASRGRGEESTPRPIIGLNLGKQKETPLEAAADDYCRLIRGLAGYGDYLAINISSPNTPQLRELQTPQFLASLIRALIDERDRQAASLQRPLPLLVKIAPDLEAASLDGMVDTLLTAGVDGLIATNTTVARSGLVSPRASESGGVSGKPLADLSHRVLEQLVARVDGACPIISVGGIFDGPTARARLDAGADLVQLYTGLIYCGPRLIAEVASGLAAAAANS